MARALDLIFGIGWGLFWLYCWRLRSKETGPVPWSRELTIRAVIVIIVVVLARLGVFRRHDVDTNVRRAEPSE